MKVNGAKLVYDAKIRKVQEISQVVAELHILTWAMLRYEYVITEPDTSFYIHVSKFSHNWKTREG